MVRGEGRKSQKRGAFGTAHKLPSGRYRAMYFGPDGRRYKADRTFLTEKDARGWLSLRQAEIIAQSWKPPGTRVASDSPTFAAYAEAWLPRRRIRGELLKVRTRQHYKRLLDDHILPTFGTLPLASITREDVVDWYDKTLSAGTPTLRSHCYGLLRTILNSAVAEDKLTTTNPCQITGAGSTRPVHRIRPASVGEIETITEHMPEQYKVMVLLAAWAALRFGELAELRRADVTLYEPTKDELASSQPIPESWGVIRVERAVVRTDEGFHVGAPKSDAGHRDVEIPPHLIPAVRDHLANLTGPGDDALLFPAMSGKHLAPASLYRHFYPARAAAKRKDLRWHDLRHSGAVLAALSGATLADLMQRLGHSTPQAAMRYQHQAAGRDRQLARKMSKSAYGDDTRK